MLTYRAPLRDIHFVMNELLEAPAHYAKLQGCEEVTPDLLAAIIDSGAKFAENVAAPLNAIGDEPVSKKRFNNTAQRAGPHSVFPLNWADRDCLHRLACA
jgi:hypothetical protein